MNILPQKYNDELMKSKFTLIQYTHRRSGGGAARPPPFTGFTGGGGHVPPKFRSEFIIDKQLS